MFKMSYGQRLGWWLWAVAAAVGRQMSVTAQYLMYFRILTCTHAHENSPKPLTISNTLNHTPKRVSSKISLRSCR